MLNRRKAISATLILSVVVILTGIYLLYQPTESTNNPALVVIRIDDIQDYAFKDAQLHLIEHSIQNKIPLSLAIIPSYFGEDTELVNAVKQNINAGSEISVHGWEHENMTQYTFNEQKMRLMYAKQTLKNTLNVETGILVPPMFSYNDDTIRAMEETDYTTISGLIEFNKKEWLSQKIQSIPATIELSDYSNNEWQIREIETILSELRDSINEFGYAIIVTHPQEFMNQNELNMDATAKYEQLVQQIAEDFSFNTIEGLHT